MKLWGGIALVTVLLLSLSIIHLCLQTTQADSQCTQNTNYTGTIDSVDLAQNTIKVYDPQAKVVDPLIGRVSMVVHANNDTHIYLAQGNSCQSASLKDLKPGQKMKIWPEGDMVVQMFPLPLRATKIVVTP
ncbi:hypothetical protein [Dictyobacter kobayashii]|nr:hypothetical protein [Dictyobacter kobayashii]